MKQPKILDAELWEIDKIHPNDYNPNEMDPKTYELAKLSMVEEGFSDPIDIDPTGMILDGEHRWRIAKELGMTHVPVFIKERYDDEAKVTTLRKDRTHGEPDLVRLSGIVGDLVDAYGSEEVERRLGYDRNEQQAFMEVDRWDWDNYSTNAEDERQESVAETIIWSVGLEPETRQAIESLLPLYSQKAAQSDYGDTEQGRFVAFVEDARLKAGIAEYKVKQTMAESEAEGE